MRKVAKYAMSAIVGDADVIGAAWVAISDTVEAWLNKKGERQTDGGTETVRFFRGGRVAELEVESLEVEGKRLQRWRLEEPIQNGRSLFRTELSAAHDEETLSLYCHLEAGNRGDIIAPMRPDPRCPKALRDLIELSIPWQVGGTEIAAKPLRLIGPGGGERLARMVRDPDRNVPLVVVSEFERFMLHPKLDEGLAKDLAGLAVVVSVDEDASWRLTHELGLEWSCFHGAIRAYWPGCSASDNPFHHPLWTAQRLRAQAQGTRDAASRLRNQLRHRILGLSALTVQQPPIFEQIQHLHRAQEREALLLLGDPDYDKLEELYAKENDALHLELQELKAENELLKAQLEQHELIHEWRTAESAPDEVAPEVEIPPETVAEAVERARKTLAGELIFGADVGEGVESLATDAGPPAKVLGFLSGLSEMVLERRRGPLGKNVTVWLSERGFTSSGESTTTRNNDAEMGKRTWHDGNEKRPFFLHMKPSDGTSPDRCVRIYFDWNEEAQKVMVGWVGRHP